MLLFTWLRPSHERLSRIGQRVAPARRGIRHDTLERGARGKRRFVARRVLAIGRRVSNNWSQRKIMISASLLRQYSAQPHAFTLHLADGRKIRVPHGDHISVQPEGRVFLLWKAKGDVEFINLTMVTSLQGRHLPDEVGK